MREFGQPEEFVGFCNVCGLPLLADGECKKYHKVKNPRRKRYSGKSNSVNKYNDYK